MQDPLNVDDLLEHSPLFLDLDDDDITLLVRDSRTVHVSRYGFALHRDDHADGFYVVVVGAVKLVLPGAHGQCKVIKFFGPDECPGEPLMLLSCPYTADAQTMEDSLLVWIGKCVADDAFHVYLRLTWQISAGLSTRLHTLMCDIETVGPQSANERLVGYLLSLPRKFDRTRFPCSKSLATSKLGLAPVMSSRTLRQSVHDGPIRMEDHEVMTQDTTALQRQLMTR